MTSKAKRPEIETTGIKVSQSLEGARNKVLDLPTPRIYVPFLFSLERQERHVRIPGRIKSPFGKLGLFFNALRFRVQQALAAPRCRGHRKQATTPRRGNTRQP